MGWVRGVVIGSFGDVVVAVCAHERGYFVLEVAEAMAMRVSLKTTMEAGFDHLVVETDNMKLYDHVRKGFIEPSDFGNIVADILNLARSCVVFVVSFVMRQGNALVLCLAKLSSPRENFRVWLEEYPPEVASAVKADLDGLSI